MKRPLHLPVTEPSEAGEARRRVQQLAEAVGFNETDAGRAALLATEMAGNLVKHAARGGYLVVQTVAQDGRAGVEILALDSGPGMANVAVCMRDGYSTAGSPGTGLGAVSRVADTFDVHSLPGIGTALLARVWSGGGAAGPGGVPVGAVSIPKPGQEVCGDGWSCAVVEGRTLVLVVDGLGHGPDAAAASREAICAFASTPRPDPVEALQRMHSALRSTRGAAAAVAVIDPGAGTIRYAGVGNVAGTVLAGGETRSLVSMAGIVGHEARRMQEFDYPFPAGALLVMHSDGVGSRWMLDRYAGITARDPMLVAGVIFRDFARGTDDATVAVARSRAPAPGSAG